MPKDISDKDKAALELGKKLQEFLDLGYANKKQAFKFSFLKGIATGAGAFIGGTIVVAILIWALNGFNQIPLVGPITRQVQEALKKPSE